MSRTIKAASPATIVEEITERTWRLEIFAEWGTEYCLSAHREQVTLLDGVPTKHDRSGSEADPGAPEDGTDGSDPAHYQTPTDAKIAVYSAKLSEIAAHEGSVTTTGGDAVPIAELPSLIIQAIEILVTEQVAAQTAQAIADAVANVAL